MAKSPSGAVPDLPALVIAEKELIVTPTWIDRGADSLDFTAPLEIDGVAVEGLTLRGRARKPLADREVVLQLEYHGAEVVGGPICRIEWRPLNKHNNKGLGPKHLQHIIQDGSHHHPFNLNWERSQTAVLRGELPIAVPIDDPGSFRGLLAVVGKEFRIRRIQCVAVPPWEPKLL
jgi:hypothetical protein